MDIKTSRTARKLGVIVNYGALALFLIFYYIGYHNGGGAVVAACAWLTLAVTLVSFYIIHVKTGLWRFSHSSIDKLDERQVMVTHDALRLSYAVFTVTCLLIMLFNATTGYRGNYMFDAVLPFCFLYFAHTLPASVIAWKEAEV